MECNPTSKTFSIYIDSKVVNCPGNETVLSNPNGLSGQIKCPDYNLVCTSQVWCNDIFDCIEKKSEADLSTYDYLYNKLELQKRDSAKLEIDDSILILEDKSSIISLNLNLIILLFMLLINF